MMRHVHVWADTNKIIKWINSYTIEANINNNRTYNICNSYYWPLSEASNLYPVINKEDINKFRIKTIKPDSKLYFDQGSEFPRFKLNLSANKRTIKPEKADVIVVSSKPFIKTTFDDCIVIEDDEFVFIMEDEHFERLFKRNFNQFIKCTSAFQKYSNPKLIYTGKLTGLAKNSLFIDKYLRGEYTLNFITDTDLDKIISNMCPEPTYNELEGIIDMLNSEDVATVQLGVKMIEGYNVDKYKMTLRLILCTRSNWYLYTRNTVGAKQLCETLDLNRYNINDSFMYSCKYACRDGETYTVEDVALAKKIGKKLIIECFQEMYNGTILKLGQSWIPDERKIELK